MELQGDVVEDDGVAGVVAAGVTHDQIGVFSQDIDELALALVTPLHSDYDRGRHVAGAFPTAVRRASRFGALRLRNRVRKRGWELGVRDERPAPFGVPGGGTSHEFAVPGVHSFR